MDHALVFAWSSEMLYQVIEACKHLVRGLSVALQIYNVQNLGIHNRTATRSYTRPPSKITGKSGETTAIQRHTLL